MTFKKIILVTVFFLANALFASPNNDFIKLADKAKLPFKLDKETAAYLKQKTPKKSSGSFRVVSPADQLIQFCNDYAIAFKWDKISGEYSAVQKNNSFENDWNLSCEKIRQTTKSNKIEPLLFSVESYQTGDEPDTRVIDIFGFSLDEKTALKNSIIKNGGEILSELVSMPVIVARVPTENISTLAEEKSVKWILKTRPNFSALNNGARENVGGNDAAAPPYNYSGNDVDVLVYDGGLVANHVDLSGRRTLIETGSTAEHATHVAGTIAGDGAASGGEYRGMADEARIISGEYDGNAEILFYNNPADIEADYNLAINTYGADLANNSIGMNIQGNRLPTEYYGDYETCSILVDSIATGSLGNAFLTVWAAGNERGYPIADYGNIAPPQCAKNSLVIGATYSDNNQVTSFSSFGPLDDGRLKPDLCAPGSETGAGIYSTVGTDGYKNMSGTSMASPVATGCATLFTESWREYHSGENPAPAVVKAVLINTTLDIDSPGPGFDSGYGLLQIIPALETIEKNNIIEDNVGNGKIKSFPLLIDPTSEFVRVTLVWSDPPASPLANPVLVNDLDLVLIDPTNGVHYPWTLDPANPSNPAVNNSPDHLNNVEQVLAENFTSGVWHVEISGFNIQVGDAQDFAVCANSDLKKVSSEGNVQLDKKRYTAPAELIISVSDIDISNQQNVSVIAVSDTEPGGETVSLSKISPGWFSGSITLTTGVAAADGNLQVSHLDSVSVSYIDQNDGKGGVNISKTAAASIDLVPPTISNVSVHNISDVSATVNWATDEPTIGKVILISSGKEFYSNLYGTNHSVNLSSLTTGLEYEFKIVAADLVSLTTTNDNSGNYFSFYTSFLMNVWKNDAEDNYENLAVQDGWVKSKLKILSGDYSWFCGGDKFGYWEDYDAYLETVPISIYHPEASLKFIEFIQTEANYDLCYLQITTNNGADWLDLRPPVSGDIGTRNVDIPLRDYLPGTFSVRFHFSSDFDNYDVGWFVDDIEIGVSFDSSLVVFDTFIFDPLPGGDNDSYPESGETVELQALLYNASDRNLTNVNSTLFCDNSDVTILQNSATYGNVPLNSYAANSNLFRFELDANIPNGTIIPFILFCSGNDGFSKSNSFSLKIENVASIAGKITDKSSGTPVNNAKVFCRSSVKTYSTLADENGDFDLSGLPDDSYDVWAQAFGFVDSNPINISCPPGISNLNIELGAPVLRYAPLDLYAVATQGQSVVEYLAISNIGNADLTFSLWESNSATLASGYDNSGEYKWTDSDNTNCPNLEWEDITDDGTKLYLSDDGSSILLPLMHSFPFYNQSVTGISISANGALILNEIKIANIPPQSFPNYKPSANCIAPFWCNLYPPTGCDLYYKSTYQKTIISYGNITRSSALGTARVSFQVILFPNGNFKFQYLNTAPQLGVKYTVGWQGEDRTKYKTLSYKNSYLKSNFVVYISPKFMF